MVKVLEFCKAHWKVLAVIAAILGAYVLGCFFNPQPAKVVTEIKEVEKVVTVEKEVVKTVIQVVKEVEVQVQTHTVVVKETTPDGGVRETTVIDTNSDTKDKEKVVEYVDRVVEKIVDREVFIEKKVIVDNQRYWRASLLLGLQPKLIPPSVDAYLVGAEIERRVVGPVWLGIWGMGSTVGVASAGLKVGIDF